MNKTTCAAFLALTLLVGTSVRAATSSAAAPTEQTVTSTFPQIFPQMREVEQDGLSPQIGVTAGLVSPEGSYKTGAEYGVNVGLQPYIPFGLGMSITFSSNDAKSTDTRSLDRTSVLLRGTYNFGGNVMVIKNSFVGVATGPIFNQDAMYLGLAPIAGFDIPVREWSGKYLSYLTVGAEARYLMVSSDESDSFTLNGAVKYWF